ncbi:MAG: hypothetical protein ACPL7C_07580, partial [Anaerolineae bacterium]
MYYWFSAAILRFTPVQHLEKWYVPNPFYLVGAPHGNGASCLQFPQATSVLMAGRILSWLLGTLTIWGVYRGAR